MTEKELFQEILKRMSADKELSAILKKMKAGTADFEDMQRYSLRTAEIRAEVLKENLSPAGTGQNEEACIQILKDQHDDVFQKESAVQKVLDEKQNIHIEPKKPNFPAERVRKAAHSLEDKTVSEEVIQRRAENAVANIANSFHDDYIKENAEFRQNAGLKCHVTRTGASKCCAWCAEVAGRYEVGKEPADFWRRHDNCSCRMDYENQKVRQRLSGTGKGWKVDSETQRRQAQRIEYKPTRFTKEQAKALESQKLSQYRGLTNQAGSGTIRTSGGVSGALNPNSKRANEHAERYYKAVRKMKTDVQHISQNTGYSIEQIEEIKKFIFLEKHDLGDGRFDYFDPSYLMAETWQRLIDGKNILPHDLTLLRHETMERELMQQGYSQVEAHIITSRTYNFEKEAMEYYAKINGNQEE